MNVKSAPSSSLRLAAIGSGALTLRGLRSTGSTVGVVARADELRDLPVFGSAADGGDPSERVFRCARVAVSASDVRGFGALVAAETLVSAAPACSCENTKGSGGFAGGGEIATAGARVGALGLPVLSPLDIAQISPTTVSSPTAL